MNDTTSAVRNRGTSAAGELLATLTRIGGAAAALWGIAYYVGWSELAMYYTTLGCPWLTHMLPTSVVLQAAMASIMGFGLFGLFAAYVVYHSRAAVRVSYRIALLSLIVATGITLALGVLHLYFKAHATFEIAAATTLTFYAATGFLAGELIASFAESGKKWHQRHLRIVIFIAVYALSVQPWSLGYSRAQYDGDVRSSRLPKASLLGTDKHEDWRVVIALDQEVLLIQLTPRAQDRTFRFVKPEQIETVSSSEPSW